MSNDSDTKHSRKRSYSRERDRSRRSRSRSRDRDRERERERERERRDTNDRRRNRSRERDRDRDRERDRERMSERYRDKERDVNRNNEREKRNENEKYERNENYRDNRNNSEYNAKRPRIENNNNSKPGNSNLKNENKSNEGGEEKKKIEKEKPNYKLTGKLAAEANTYNGVVLKYSEPPEARKTKTKWRFHIFKGDTQLEPLPVYKQSGYLLGRDRLVADIPIDHPSCSKQHAALQYRQVQGTDEETGEAKMIVKPYLIDLNSSNGTFINGEKLEPSRYYELKQGDVIKFGFSTRDYIFIDEDSV